MHEIRREVVDVRQGHFQYDVLVWRKPAQMVGEALLENCLRLALLRAVDVDFGLDYGNEPGGHDLRRQLELLVDHRRDAAAVAQPDERPHFGTEDAIVLGTRQQRGKGGYGIHDLDTVVLWRQALVHLQEGDHALDVPQIRGRAPALDVAI